MHDYLAIVVAVTNRIPGKFPQRTWSVYDTLRRASHIGEGHNGIPLTHKCGHRSGSGNFITEEESQATAP